ncbi:hypothetical protein DFJ73DRAFT_864667, partial [Zopfochytrium polystomum]
MEVSSFFFFLFFLSVLCSGHSLSVSRECPTTKTGAPCTNPGCMRGGRRRVCRGGSAGYGKGVGCSGANGRADRGQPPALP